MAPCKYLKTLFNNDEQQNPKTDGSRLESVSGFQSRRRTNSTLARSDPELSRDSSPDSFQTGSRRISETHNTSGSTDHMITFDGVDNYYGYRRLDRPSIESIINVNISDIMGSDSIYATTTALKRCKTKVLDPYNILIKLIGWRRWKVDTNSRFVQVLNSIYLSFILMLLLFGYFYQTISCSGKLNLQKDTIITAATLMTNRTTVMTTTTASINVSTSVNQELGVDTGEHTGTNHAQLTTDEPPYFDWLESCNHVVSTYIIPSLLHIIAFLYGVYHFRWQENEQLHSLMERVFLQAQATMGAQERLIRNCRLFLFGGVAYLLLCLIVEIIFIMAYGHTAILIRSSTVNCNITLYVLSGVGIAGVMLQHCIIVAVILNYGTQCEMVSLYTHGLCLRLHEKSQELTSIMHEILGIRGFVSLLNGVLARITAILVVVFSEMTIIGVCLLVLNRIVKWTVITYRILFFIVWFVALMFPMCQAARLTKIGRLLDQTAFEMRVFGYKNVSQLDLDSFILFVGNAKIRAKLFSVPITPALLTGFCFVIGLSLILMFQSGVIGNESFF